VSIEEGAKYVAAAYAVIMAALIFYYFLSARRAKALERDVELLEEEIRRLRSSSGAGGDE
jgi:hypothetical protein